MKKVLALSLLAIAAFVSQVGAEHCKEGGQLAFCQWSTGCYTINNDYGDNVGKECSALITSCKNDGALYTGSSVPPALSAAPYGEGANCANEGLTKAAGGNEKCGYYCLWETGCKEITTDINGDYGPAVLTCIDAIANCDKDGARFSDANCSGSQVGGAERCNKWCKWTETGECKAIIPDPSGEYGPAVANCAEAETNCEAGGTVFTDANCGGGGTPIYKFTPASQALIVAPYGRSLHISSARDAMVSLYDMSGAKVYSGRVSAGNRVFSLQTVPAGSYYAVVQSGSDAKKVPVILK